MISHWGRCAVLIVLAGTIGSGCSSRTRTGALVGGMTGAAVGAGIGSVSKNGNAGGGALIGGVVGTFGGALVGNAMDRSEERRREEQAVQKYEQSSSRVPQENAEVTRRDVVDWSRRGIKDEVIIERIEHSGCVFQLTAKDQNDLRDQGVSEDVIQVMRDTGRKY